MVKVKGAKEQIIIAANDQFDLRKRQRVSESTSPMKNQRSFVLDSISNYSSQSTSIGSEMHGRHSLMLPREHNMTKEQLISKVHREMQDVMEFIAQMHDKLGNGFAALLHAFKKINPQITERVRKDLDKRAF